MNSKIMACASFFTGAGILPSIMTLFSLYRRDRISSIRISYGVSSYSIESIEKDSGDCDPMILENLMISHWTECWEFCKDHVDSQETDQADTHYRAVCRALVAEVQELSSFLQKVSEGTDDLYLKADTVASSEALDRLRLDKIMDTSNARTTARSQVEKSSL